MLVTSGAWTPGLLARLHGRLRPVAQTMLYLRPADAVPFRSPLLPTWAFEAVVAPAATQRNCWRSTPVARALIRRSLLQGLAPT